MGAEPSVGDEAAGGTALREPQQGRSRASFERMLSAAAALLRERGSDDFTLLDVSKKGKVSIGSIYHRFDSKDELIQAVHRRFIEQMIERQGVLIGKAVRQGDRLETLMHALIEEIAELLRQEGAMLRPLMRRASADPVVGAAGRLGYIDMHDRLTAAIMAFRSEIRHPDPDRAVASVIRIMYAAIARFLGFGATETPLDPGNWADLKEDLSDMCTAFLLHAPKR
jgi:AcrR family transcriptional regulator